MELNGQDDALARWIQGIFAILLLLVGLACVNLLPSILGILLFVKWGIGFSFFYLAYRCLRYALTGKNNINLDGFS